MSFEAVLGFWCWDVRLDKIYADPEVCEYFGVPREDGVRGASPTEFVAGIHRSDRDDIVRRVGMATASGKRFSETYRVVSPKHGTKTIHAYGVCFRDASGRPSQYPGVIIRGYVRHDVAPIHAEIADHLVWARELSDAAREPLLGRLIDAVLLEAGYRLAARIKAQASRSADVAVVAPERLQSDIRSSPAPDASQGGHPLAGSDEPDEGKAAIRLQPIRIALPDSEGRGVLVYSGVRLVAVLAQLGDEAGEGLTGHWTIEAGFDHMGVSTGRIFADLEDAQDWIGRQVR